MNGGSCCFYELAVGRRGRAPRRSPAGNKIAGGCGFLFVTKTEQLPMGRAAGIRAVECEPCYWRSKFHRALDFPRA